MFYNEIILKIYNFIITRLTDSAAKIRKTEEKSEVEVRRKNAKLLDFRRISAFLGLSERLPARADGQTC